MTGTLLNTIVVILAGIAGALIGNRLPAKIRETGMHGIGLTTLLIGLQMALGARNLLVVLGSLVVGGAVGEILGIETGLERLGRWVENRLAERSPAAASGERKRGTFARAFVTASLVFCVGPMAITGAIQDGLTGNYDTLAVKSLLDGITGLAFASTMGIGVAFSSGVVLVYQGALTLAAAWLRDLLTEAVRAEMVATGGLLIVGIGLNLLNLMRIRVSNLLPALLLAPLVTGLLANLAP
ncbi:MAG: DUF554 domain-containing protein [Chloroflexi bacterium]|nr:DUF554 domain-containing protein [Chloroflexota bacterium]MCL5107696.1 DUF554 domain-containing protein [Chloroflexota bacterium]